MNVINGLREKAHVRGLDKILSNRQIFQPEAFVYHYRLASLVHNHPRDSVLRCGVILGPLLPRDLVSLGEGADALAEARNRRHPADVVHRDRHFPDYYSDQRSSQSPSSALSS